jgi:hypothetical protein
VKNYYWIYNKTNPWPRQSEFYKDDPRKLENIDLKSVIDDKKLEIMIMNRRYQSNLLSEFYTNANKDAKEIIAAIEK